MMRRVLVPVADGSEEIETACIVDVLRRASLEVTLASCAPEGQLHVTCSRGLRVVADQHITALAHHDYDAVVLPGGMPGAQHLRDCPTLCQLLREHSARGALIGAICAAPAVVLAPLGLLTSRQATAHPSFQSLLGCQLRPASPVVEDGNIITSQGPGSAIQFALALVKYLCDENTARSLGTAMVVTES